MLKIKHIAVAILATLTLTAGAQPAAMRQQSAAPKCDIDISVANITKGDIVPPAVNNRLEARLVQALSKAGLTSAPYDSRFFVAGRFDNAFNDITGGPSPKVIIKTTLTIYIGDADEQKIFASESFDLKGVGGTDEQAFTNALKGLSGTNPKLVKFLAEGKDKIVEYYDNNYMSYINNAKNKMAARQYDEALYYATAIPSCCKGYNEAEALALQIYNQSLNFNAEKLLSEARAAWAADPTAAGAEKAYSFLSQIDPAAKCIPQAKALGEEMTRTTKKQWEFENVTKYKDQLAMENKKLDAQIALENKRINQQTYLESKRIAAARAVGIAYAQSRPRVVNRYVFIH